MKFMDKISLRMRITLLSGTILLLCSVILTLGAYYNAHTQFNNITLGGQLTVVPGTALPRMEIYPSVSATAEPMITKPALTVARQQFDTTNIMILAVVSVLGMVMVYIIAGRSLRPIYELSRTISAISEDNLRQRIPDDHPAFPGNYT